MFPSFNVTPLSLFLRFVAVIEDVTSAWVFFLNASTRDRLCDAVSDAISCDGVHRTSTTNSSPS